MSLRKQVLQALAAVLVTAGLAGAAEDVKIRFNVDPIGKAYELNKSMAADYEKAHPGIKVEIIAGPIDATDRIALYQQYLTAKSPDVDVYQVDVIWPGILARHLVDLGTAFAKERSEFFVPIVANNTVDGKLVAIPWYADAGVLYYRTDLLKKYGFANPPVTWEELELQAKKIQEGERAAGNKTFSGFVFQAAPYEGLTCNALEWQASSGGGTIVNEKGEVTVNNPKAVAAFQQVHKWVGSIAPEGVTTYREEECRGAFQAGNAAFMRNWPYAYSLCQGADSAVKDKFAVCLLPTGGTSHAAALGGWQLSVSKYSKHQAEAIEFVRYMTSEAIQKRRAIEGGLLASRPALYNDPEICKAIPYFASMKPVFESATPRPSTVSGKSYNQISTAYFQAVNKILAGTQEPGPALSELETKLKGILR